MFLNLFILSFFVSVFSSNVSPPIILNKNNFVSLIGPVSTSSVDDVIQQTSIITDYIQEHQSFYFFINSPGGSVFAGNHLIQYMLSLQESGIHINCISANYMSMAFIIFQVCSTRNIMWNSLGMQHQISLGISGNIENLVNQLDMIERVNQLTIDLEIKRINISYPEYKKRILSDWWLYGSEAITQNVADKKVNVICSSDILQKSIIDELVIFDQNIQIVRSACPLINKVKILNANSTLEPFFDTSNFHQNVKTIFNLFN